MSRTAEQMRMAKKLMKKPWGDWKAIDLSTMAANLIPSGMTRSYMNNHFVVMVFNGAETSAGPAIKVMVQRHDDAPIHDWKALQRVKNELFGYDRTAIEYYPPQAEVVDDANIYWLWLFEPGVIPAPVIGRPRRPVDLATGGHDG